MDNASTDGSIAILEEYLGSGKLTVVRSRRNLGCPGGRNLGLLHARGDVIAFMDNDGYADPKWLETAIARLDTDASVGAVAPVVFFAKRPIILNGSGGTINYQGYGCDHGFKTPYEFASLPTEVLYPMGCGMVIRRSVMDRAGRFDDAVLNYYDDAELGIRVWKLGYRVVVEPSSFVDHELSFSDQFVSRKAELCERGRTRTVLKYFPLSWVLAWIPREISYGRRYPLPKRIILRAWAWNVLHLASALRWRLRFRNGSREFLRLLHPSWGSFPPAIPANEALRPDLERCAAEVALDGSSDGAHLNFGWYYPETAGGTPYRWTDVEASVLLMLPGPAQSLTLEFCSPARDQRIEVLVRRPGEVQPVFSTLVEAPTPSWSWRRGRYPCRLDKGPYEVVLRTTEPYRDGSGRTLGIAVSRIALRPDA